MSARQFSVGGSDIERTSRRVRPGAGVSIGADAYVTKPFSPQRLVETLTRVVAAQPASFATERELGPQVGCR
jgi:DNA-binding response OmpR family regulator